MTEAAASPLSVLADIAFTSQSELRRLDSECLNGLRSGVRPIDQKGLIGHAQTLPLDLCRRLVRHYVSGSLLSVAACVCQRVLGTENDPSLRSEYSKILHYLGLSDQAFDNLLNSNLHSKDRNVLSLALHILVDTGRWEEAKALQLQHLGLFRDADAAVGDLSRRIATLQSLVVDDGSAARNAIQVVNLPQDRYRRIALEHRLSHLGLHATIGKAVRIDDIPADLEPLLRIPLKDVVDGSYGNQMSQFRIWQAASREPPGSYTVVLEDDAYPLCESIASFDYAALSGGADIIFINDRLCPSQHEVVACAPLKDRLVELSYADPMLNSPGSDAYVVSQSGAEKLIQIAETEGFHSVGTDWYLTSHAISDGDMGVINPGSTMYKTLAARRRLLRPGAECLVGAIFKPALVEHRPLGVWRDTRVLW